MNTSLKLFSSLVLANNNLPLKIYYENIIVAFTSFKFLFFILFFSFSLFLSSTRYLYFFFPFFSPPHTYSLSSPYLHFWLFFILFFFTRLPPFHPLSFQNIPFLFSLSLLCSPHLATQPTPTHFFTLIFFILFFFSNFNHTQLTPTQFFILIFTSNFS